VSVRIANDTLGEATAATLAAVDRFNAAFNGRDVDAIMAAMTGDPVFEGTSPPDGDRHVGAVAVRAYWERFFAAAPETSFDAEETVVVGDRAVVRWRYTWLATDGSRGHVRGVDVFRVRDGLIAEKLAYVKG
jgi:hypothetical protein